MSLPEDATAERAPFPWRGFAIAYAVPALLTYAVGRRAVAGLAAPLAGPWAARLYGHSCGMDSGPSAAIVLPVLVALGVGAIAGAVVGRARRWRWPWLPLAVWWGVWCAAAWLSVVNAME